MAKKLIVSKIMSDVEVSKLEGTWIEESHIKLPIIRTDTDVYYLDENNNELLLLKFRKKVISDKLIKIGWDSYKDLAKASRGRGASAGPVDPDSDYWKKRILVKTNKWSTGYLNTKGNEMYEKFNEMTHYELIQLALSEDLGLSGDSGLNDPKNKSLSTLLTWRALTPEEREEVIMFLISKRDGVSKMKVNNQVASNPVGFYEAGKNFADLPCRLTHFTRTNYEKYNQGLKFIQRINTLFKNNIPTAYDRQIKRANKTIHLKIPKTAFSTVTINRNFRTALHRDAGDFKGGFGNLTVIERGKYRGGYTVFPQFGIGIDLRNNDFVAMDVHQWHSNTPTYETEDDKLYNETLEPDYHDNPEVGTGGLYKKYTRLSFVCYLREKIEKCPALSEIDPRFLTKSGHSKIV